MSSADSGQPSMLSSMPSESVSFGPLATTSPPPPPPPPPPLDEANSGCAMSPLGEYDSPTNTRTSDAPTPPTRPPPAPAVIANDLAGHQRTPAIASSGDT